ncbi:MAG: TM0106 family RecB-like putative nuclease [Cyclobacteriaceae bacterium]|nr:TM0106 family RecB-like putative nuclease [Cyclobacteriaceae bacterium]
MQITDGIIHDLIHCPYKAYRKFRHEKGNNLEYQQLYDRLKQIQQERFSKTINRKEEVVLNYKFTNATIDLTLDGVEFTGGKSILPIFISPFEKIKTVNKLFVALQAMFIQDQFDLRVDTCKIIYGRKLQQTKFRLSTFTKPVKKLKNDLDKVLHHSNPPAFFKNSHCPVCEFQKNCFERLVERDDLSLLAGLKPKEIQQKNNRGIFSVKQLSYTFRSKKSPLRKRKFMPELKALAIREGKAFIHEMLVLKSSETEVFLDFEGIIDKNYNYLIGAIIKTGNTENRYSFWADNEQEQVKIFIDLISILKPLNQFIVYHYGSYETQALKNILKILPAEYHDFIRKIMANSVNILDVFIHHIYPPTYSNSLKEIAGFLKFEWSEKDASGLKSTFWRYYWELSNDAELKHKLITYNLEDCKALIAVKDWIISISSGSDKNFENAAHVRKESLYKWGKADFAVKELEQINQFAYFNYQREKVFIKTYPEIARQQKKISAQRLKPKRKLRPNSIIEIQRPIRCPACSGVVFHKHDKYERKVIDLKITQTGIKRWITLYRLTRFKCKECKKVFVPKDFSTAHSRYGRTLNCWIINQVVHYRMSYNKVAAQLKESFDIDYQSNAIQYLKSYFSEFYSTAYNELIEQIKNSPLIHIDETTFHVGKENGYVWVFTNIDTVFYLFRPTRESDFLKELLANFKGVLISDFYGGYDAVQCPKQRCLIHLIRDLNDDLVKNPFNHDYKTIVLNFSKLLNDIVLTVHKHGLRKRNLNKHKKDVSVFFSVLNDGEFESALCEKWQKRFCSLQSELFTFLDYDGIPWNNNNAEAAIKAVALYRREVDGLPTPKRLQEYLILLSLHQTCKYRGISFIEFLKAGKASLSGFIKSY